MYQNYSQYISLVDYNSSTKNRYFNTDFAKTKVDIITLQSLLLMKQKLTLANAIIKVNKILNLSFYNIESSKVATTNYMYYLSSFTLLSNNKIRVNITNIASL